MSSRRLFSRAFVRPTLLRYYSVVVDGPSESHATPLLARASLASEVSDVKPKKSDLVIERKVLAYPPPHYFDTHKVISQLQQAGSEYVCFVVARLINITLITYFIQVTVLVSQKRLCHCYQSR